MQNLYKTLKTTRSALLVLFMGILMLAANTSFGQATITTDKLDYAPGETAIFTGSGFDSLEVVTLSIKHIEPNLPDPIHLHSSWDIIADSTGNFIETWYVEEQELYTTLYLTAIGQTSGLMAETVFTDGNYRFSTSGLPSGIPVTVDYSYPDATGSSITFNSESTVDLDPKPNNGDIFTYTFPPTIDDGTDTYNLKSSLPASPFTITNATTNFTGTYEIEGGSGGLTITAPNCAQGGEFTITYIPATGTETTDTETTPHSFDVKKNTSYTISSIAFTVNGNTYDIDEPIFGMTPNSNDFMETVTLDYNDTEDPTIVDLPDNIEVSNDEGVCGAIVSWTAPTSADNCDEHGIEQTAGAASGTTFPVGNTIITYTSTDAAGNSVYESFTITVTDDELPVITDGADITQTADAEQCGAIVSVTAATAADNCGVQGSVVGTRSDAPLTLADPFPVGKTTITWTVSDIHGNPATAADQLVTVTDNEDPEPNCPTPANQYTIDVGECDATLTFEASPTDNCGVESTAYSVEGTEISFPYDFPVGTTTIDVRVTDIYSNTDACSFDVVVEDNGLPTISHNTTELFSCVGTNPSKISSTVSGGNPPFTYQWQLNGSDISEAISSDYNPDAFDIPGIYEYTVVVTDVCDKNATSAPKIINIATDPSSVVISGSTTICPGETATLEVIGTPGIGTCGYNWQSGQSASGPWTNLSPAASNAQYTTSALSSTSYYRAVYDCTGNSCNQSTHIFTVTVDELPVITTTYSNITVNNDPGQCGAILSYTAASATGIPTPTLSYSAASGFFFPLGTTTVTVTSTNSCGADNKTFDVIVVDNEVPSWDQAMPSNKTVECNSVPTPATVLVSDNCPGITLNYSEVRTDGSCLHSYTLTRTWTAIDNSNNSLEHIQKITVVDTKAPSISCPADITIECTTDESSVTNGVATGSDDCGDVVITESDAVVENCGDTKVITRTWTATDECGNASSADQIITIVDTSAPSALCKSTTVQLDANGLGSILASDIDDGSSDNCGIVSLLASQTSFECSNIGSNTVTLTVTDACNNISTCNATVLIEDNIDPVITCPADVTLDCDADNSSTATGVATATDNCDPAVAITESDVSTQVMNVNDPGYYNYTITRTWKATDITGNFTECVQTIDVQDVTKPDITCPADVTINCEDDILSASNGMATGLDICSSVAITESDVTTQVMNVNDPGYYNYTITRTWKATDITGNFTECVQTIDVQDVTKPDITCPADVTINCEDDILSASNGMATGLDICSSVAITESDVSTQVMDVNDPGYYNYTITRTWKATDITGNFTECVQIITVQDVTAPTVECKPATVELDADGEASITEADIDNGSSDICGDVTLALDNYTFSCDDVGAVNTVILTVTDASNNASTCEATVTVEGIIPEVNVTESVLPEFCQGAVLQLTANSAEAIAWEWTNEAGDIFATTQVAEISDDGIYGVSVTSATNCTTYADYTVSGYDAGALISSYTLIAEEDIHLHDENIVYGGVGVTKEGKSVKLHKSSSVTGLVQASKIELKDDSEVVGDIIYAPANPIIPDFIYNELSEKSSPNVKVAKGDMVILYNEVYGKVEIEDGATAIFAASNINIDELKTKKNATIEFEACANLYINKHLKLEDNCTFNSRLNTVIVFVDDKVEVKAGSKVTARIHANSNDIHVKGTKDKLTEMNGMFIGKKIHGDKYVTWNMDRTCAPCELINPYDAVCDDCKGGITELILQYNGPDTYTDEYDITNRSQEIVVANKKGEVLYSGTHAPGDQFEFNAYKKGEKMSSYIYLFVGGYETGSLHVSCSKPIGTGMLAGEFDEFVIIDGLSKDNGPLCLYDDPEFGPDDCKQCKGGIIELTLNYYGDDDDEIVVKNKDGDELYNETYGPDVTINFTGLGKDRKMTSHIDFYVNDILVENLHVSCSQPIGAGMNFGEFEIIEGIGKDNIPLCKYVGETISEANCGDCKGGIDSLTVQKIANIGGIVELRDKDGVVLYNGTPGEDEFKFSCLPGNYDKKSPYIYLYIDDVEVGQINVSCSKPIGTGQVVSNFEIVAGTSTDGGALCAYGEKEAKKSAEISPAIRPSIEPVLEDADLKVYPNPFTERLKFEFVSPETSHAQIDLYDATGRKIKTVFEGTVQSGVTYNAEFVPTHQISGFYVYRMTLNDEVYTGRVIFKAR